MNLVIWIVKLINLKIRKNKIGKKLLKNKIVLNLNFCLIRTN